MKYTPLLSIVASAVLIFVIMSTLGGGPALSPLHRPEPRASLELTADLTLVARVAIDTPDRATEAPAVLGAAPDAPARVFTAPTSEALAFLDLHFTPPEFEEFQQVIARRTDDVNLATALWQIPEVREAYLIYTHGNFVLGFVQDYCTREMIRASCNLPSVPLVVDLGYVWRFLLAHAADSSAMRAALEAFESAVAVVAQSRDQQAAYDAEPFCVIRDQLETQIRAVPCSVRALHLLRQRLEGERK